MTKKSKLRSGLWLVVKSVVVGSAVFSRTFAAPTPATPDHIGLVDNWRSLGQQMGATPSALPPLDESLKDMIALADLENNLTDVVMASYEMVLRDQRRALDAHWAEILTETGSAELVAEFLNLRSGINFDSAEAAEADALVWLASRRGGAGCDGCNSGNGNGSEPRGGGGGGGNDCDPGNSGNVNNGRD
ncbi:hypothetical protein [Yoonia litorea]|uniref:Uncharacterized protein n=1 Tax=Yoonia litorea TaxID=1123755 RepID=A0A1I6N2R6_9RHOB|nr:hypothetical protein [Yoonia litorea]SFS22243.1 hypothetical protein SAMN05444714_3217 [Yoonia litorea]